MESVLNTEVSCFERYSKTENPVTINLLTWLQSDKHYPVVKRIRSLSKKKYRDAVKAQLPCITPHGTFTQRGAEYLIKHSGFLQYDIDLAENKHITNYARLKSQLCNIQNVAYCGLSVSGTGFWGLIPIAYPEKHTAHFLAMERDFKAFGIILDTKPKNVASLRGYSYDEYAHFNHQAQPYQKTYTPPVKKVKLAKTNYSTTGDFDPFAYTMAKLESDGEYFTDGNKHSYLRQFCRMLNGWGVEADEVRAYVYQHFVSPDQVKSNCLTDPFTRYAHEFGTYIKDSNKSFTKKPLSNTPENQSNIQQFTSTLTGQKFELEINQHGYPAMWDS